ncbi:response regulator [soil metagenome]
MTADRVRVLYVDDEADIRTIVQIALRLDPGMEVKLAASGAEALALIGQDGWTPDIALIDVMMPGLTGMELVERVRDDPTMAGMPILFVTASARSSDIARYIGAGAVGVISKPFDPLTLAAHVRRHLASARA